LCLRKREKQTSSHHHHQKESEREKAWRMGQEKKNARHVVDLGHIPRIKEMGKLSFGPKRVSYLSGWRLSLMLCVLACIDSACLSGIKCRVSESA
jgi:hypothetical protein